MSLERIGFIRKTVRPPPLAVCAIPVHGALDNEQHVVGRS